MMGRGRERTVRKEDARGGEGGDAGWDGRATGADPLYTHSSDDSTRLSECGYQTKRTLERCCGG